MALQDSDLLYLERGGVIYQTNWNAIRTRTVAATDLALIERGGAHYKVAIGDFWDCTAASQVGDNFLIERNTTLYHEEILFPCSVRIDVSGATTTTVLVSGTPINGIPATILQPDGTEVVITAVPTAVTLTQNGTYEFSGNISEFKIQGSDGLVDASLDPATKWTSVFSGVSDFGNGTFTNITALSGLPANLPVTTLDGTFEGTSITAANISSLDVSGVTSAVGTFKNSGISPANDITSWDVTNVVNMSRMFENAVQFNSDISTWDISNVVDMSSLFKNATLFNADLSIWASDVVGVTNMSNMFANVVLFNQDLSQWDTSSVLDMAHMFDLAGSFNQDLGEWDVSCVSNMDSMFSAAGQFDQDITDWCVSLIPTKPAAFSTSSPLQTANEPIWGQCDKEINGQLHFISNTFSKLHIVGAINTAGVIENPDGTTYNIGPGNFDIELNAGFGYYQLPMEHITQLRFGGTGIGYDNRRAQFDFAPNFYTGAITNMNNMFNNCSDFNGDISNWDTSQVKDTSLMFRDARDFIGDVNSIDGWDMSNVTNMGSMFSGASKFNSALNSWNVSNVTHMGNVFANAPLFDQPLDNWNTKNAKTMAAMFFGAKTFNQDVSGWDVGNNKGFYGMFHNCLEFVSDLSGWNVSGATNMREMFFNARKFNSDLSGWDTSRVVDFTRAFTNAKLFNGDITTWDTSSAVLLMNMFQNASVFNQDISGWDTSEAQGMIAMFSDATVFNQDLSNWCVGQIPSEPASFDFSSGFENQPTIQPQWGTCPFPGSGTFYFIDKGSDNRDVIVRLYYKSGGSHDITYPDGSSQTWYNGQRYTLSDLGTYEFPMGVVTRMQFGELRGNQNIDFAPDFYTSKLTNAVFMFQCLYSFNGDISNWDVSKVTNMRGMFSQCKGFNGDLSAWDTSSVTNMRDLFSSAETFNSDISNWNTSKVKDTYQMFRDTDLFNADLSNWDVSNVSNMEKMFYSAPVFNAYISPWETQSATDVDSMFFRATAFDQDLSNWCLPLVTSIDSNFAGSSGFAGQTAKFPVPGECPTYSGIYLEELVGGGDMVLGGVASAPTTIRRPDGTLINVAAGSFANKETQLGWYEFQGIENYEGVRFFDNDLLFDDTSETARFKLHPRFDTSNMTQLRQMFRECHLFNGDVSMIDSSNAVNMAAMFRNARVFNQDISHFDTANATNMANMFHDAYVFDQNITQWATDQVFDMGDTFNNAGAFNQDLSVWCVPLISAKPGNFDPSSGFDGQTARQPGWGGCPGAFVIATPPVIASFSTVVPAPYGDSLIIQTEATTTPAHDDIRKVSQIWQMSTDGGTTWTDVFGPETFDTYEVNGYTKGALVRLSETWDNTSAPSTPQVTESNAIEIVDTIAPPVVTSSPNTVEDTEYPSGQVSFGYFVGSLYRADGLIQGIPADPYYNALYNPTTDTHAIQGTRSQLRSSRAFRGGATSADGDHYWASNFDAYIGQWMAPSGGYFALTRPFGNQGFYAFFGAVYSPTEDVIYFVPENAPNIEYYDPSASFSNRGPHEITPDLSSITAKFCGGILGPDGNVYFFPGNSRTFLKLDIPTRVWTTWSPADWTSPILASREVTAGGCVVGDKVYISPGYGVDILKMHFDDLDANGFPKVTSIDINAATGQSLDATRHRYNRPVLMDGGILVIVPSNAPGKILYLDTADDSITSFVNPVSISHSDPEAGNYGAILLPNGDIVSTPYYWNRYVTYKTYLTPPAGYDPNDPAINHVP